MRWIRRVWEGIIGTIGAAFYLIWRRDRKDKPK